MLNTLSLLAMKHPPALNAMMQDVLELGVTSQYLMTANPIAQSEGKMSVGVYLRAAAYQDPSWVYRGQTTFTYQRMHFGDFFAGIDLVLYTAPAIRTRTLVNMLERIFNIDIDDADYVDEDITHDGINAVEYTLRASPVSQRWYGTVPILVSPRTPPVAIFDPYLDGLSIPIPEYLSVTTLDGFTL